MPEERKNEFALSRSELAACVQFDKTAQVASASDACEVMAGKIIFHIFGKIKECKESHDKVKSADEKRILAGAILAYQDLLKRLGG